MNDQNEITEILNDGVAKKMELRRSFYEWLDKNPDSNVWQWILDKLNEQQQVSVEPVVVRLQDIADTLAMDCLQSTRYQTDPSFKKKVDDVLYLTREWS